MPAIIRRSRKQLIRNQLGKTERTTPDRFRWRPNAVRIVLGAIPHLPGGSFLPCGPALGRLKIPVFSLLSRIESE